MRAMSFMLTTAQVLNQSKTVTRRDGWLNLKKGDRLRAVKKAMGLKKGEKHEVLGIIEVVNVTREELRAITGDECTREGFPQMAPLDFVEMFCKSHKGIQPASEITRIEFKYVEAS